MREKLPKCRGVLDKTTWLFPHPSASILTCMNLLSICAIELILNFVPGLKNGTSQWLLPL